MKTLSTDAAAIALGVDRKTLDNVLAREGSALIQPGTRGRRRKIPVHVLERLAIAFILARDLEVGIAMGLELGGRIQANPDSPIPVGALTMLLFDLAPVRIALEASIEDALESVAEPTRGRPAA